MGKGWHGNPKDHKKANLKGRRKKIICQQDKKLEVCKSKSKKRRATSGQT